MSPVDIFPNKVLLNNLVSIQVNCKHCQFELGGQVPFGPNGTNLIAFGTEKVLEKELEKKSSSNLFLAGEGVGPFPY